MTERMATSDVAFLYRETRRTPQHVGGLAVFDPPAAGFDYDRLVRLIEERITLAPRFRQKVRTVPGHIANPVWVDDPTFDITYHVRRSALPRPGGDEQLLGFCARILARRLDRSRPLWEIYLVEGLAGGRVAVVTKTHEAVVGEDGGVDLAEVVLDASPAPRRTVEALWVPGPEPTAGRLVRDAVGEIVRRPVVLGDTARATARDVGAATARVTSLAGGVVSAAAAVLRRPERSPLQAELGEQRRLALARTRLEDYRLVRDAFGGSINDVVLAVVAGALRGWLLARTAPVRASTSIRALVPVSVTEPSGEPPGPNRVRPLLVDLPVGEPDPVLRLAQLRYAMASHRSSGLAVSAERLTALSGFAPPTLHALGARAAAGLTRRMFDLVVTNVPGPQVPLYAAGARMVESVPFQPLSDGQALSVALTSYDGGVVYGLTADRDAVPDVGLVASLLEESLAELVEACRGSRGVVAGHTTERRPGRRR